MEFVIGLAALLFVLAATAGAVAAARVVRAVGRDVRRTGDRLRRTAEDAALQARSVRPGPAGELARVRLELRTSLDSTRRVLEAGAEHDTSLGEAVALLDRLEEHGRRLDGELRLLEREPDRTRIAARLPETRERADRIRSSADSLRFAAQDRAQRYDGDELAALGEQIEIEATALRHWDDSGRVAPRLGAAEPEGAAGGTLPRRLLDLGEEHPREAS